MDMMERVANAIYAEFENRPLYAQAQMNGLIAEELARAAIKVILDYLDSDYQCPECDAVGILTAALREKPKAHVGKGIASEHDSH